jgi:hypothetical protein
MCMWVDHKVRIHGEYSLTQKLLIQINIYPEETEQWHASPHSRHKSLYIYHDTLSVNDVCLQHGNVGLVNKTTVTQRFEVLQQFGICDHQDTSSEDQKDGHHNIPRPYTAWQTAAMLQQSSWECLKHPSQSPDFTHSDSEEA